MNVVEPTMSVPIIGLLVLLVLLGMLVGGVVLVGTLLANRKTRGIGIFLLAGAGVFFLLAVGVNPVVRDPDVFLLAPVGLFALFVFAGVVFIAFKQGGMGIGLAVLCLPVVWMFVSYQSARWPAQVTMIDSSGTTLDPMYVGDYVNTPYAIEVPDTKADEVDTAEAEASSDANESSEETAPAPTPAAEPSKPAWVTTPPKRVGHVYRRVLQAGPYDTVGECQKAIGHEIESAVQQYVGEQADAEMHGRASRPPFTRLGISPPFIREMVREEYYETVVSSVNDNMKTLYVLLEIDAHARDTLLSYWRAYERKERIAVVAVGSGGLLAALAGLLGLLKLDTRTEGAYTKRLFIWVPLAIIGGFLLLALLA